MNRRDFLLAGLVAPAYALPGCAGGGDAPGPSAEAPASGRIQVAMAYEQPHLSVSVQLNGHTLRFVLDTGADANVVTSRAAAALGLPMSAQTVPGAGSGGVIELRVARIGDLAIGEAHLRNELAYIADVPETFPWDGAIGASFFRRFVPSFDYASRQLSLTQAERFVAPEGAARLPAQVGNDGTRMLVQARLAGFEGWFAVDTGAFNAVTVHTPSVERLGLRALAPSLRMITGEGAGGSTRGDMVRVPELQIGPWRLPRVATELSLANSGAFANDAWMGNLGGELLRRFAVTPHLAGSALYLAPNAALNEPFPGPRSGLYLQWAAGRAEVIEVIAGSPADAAGIALRDIVQSIDGEPLAAGRWVQLVGRLKQAPGSVVRLGVLTPSSGASGAGGAREVRLVLRELV